MDSNPYRSPQDIRQPRTSNTSSGKRIFFWAVVILGLPLALIAAGASICCAAAAVLVRGDDFGDSLSGTLVVVAIVLAAVAAPVGWGWWQTLKRVKKKQAPLSAGSILGKLVDDEANGERDSN